MRKIITCLASFLLVLSAAAQSPEPCATMAAYNRQQQDPVLASRYAAARQAAAAWRAQAPSNRTASAPILTVPVVVHVLYKNANQNISNAQIYSQIDVLNADYRRLNADTLQTPAIFDTIAADIEVEFCLASVDPTGAPTSGITRTSTSGGQLFGYFSPVFEDAKFDSTGGHDAWPADRYLNIWVCEAFPGLLGYAQFPGGDPATDGVVISYQAFGNTGTVAAPSTLGRTTTHEVGHWMGLYHIWGDDQDCTGSDSIYDTPNVTVASSSDCKVTRNSCSNEDPYWGAIDPTDMVQNYMDYSHDSCMNMFTLGQKARMHSFLYSDPMRLALFNSPVGCNLVGLPTSPSPRPAFEIYPNPTDGLVRVNYLGSARPEMEVEVLDFAGRLVYQYAATAYSYTLDLSALATGVYVLRIAGDAGVTTKKLVLE